MNCTSNFQIFRLSQSCNHVAAVLFRVEAAVKAGLRDPTRTSLKATWVVPASNVKVHTGPISELNIEVHRYGKSSEFLITLVFSMHIQNPSEFYYHFKDMKIMHVNLETSHVLIFIINLALHEIESHIINNVMPH